jgi:hypothetical protein
MDVALLNTLTQAEDHANVNISRDMWLQVNIFYAHARKGSGIIEKIHNSFL